MPTALLAAPFAAGLLAVVAACVSPTTTRRSVTAGGLCVLAAVLGTLAGGLAMAGSTARLTLPTALPGMQLVVDPDRLGGFFLLLVSAVAVLAAWTGAATEHGPAASRTGWSAFAVFVAGMQLVAAAANPITFLLGWELMALGSAALVLADHAHRVSAVRSAVWYAAMSQLSFVLLAAGFATLCATSGPSADFAHLTADGSARLWGASLIALGCAVKMGLVPVHVWLPHAHPEAPTYVSALMSAAMVKLGVYGLLLVCLRLVPDLPAWWGAIVLATGGVSAAYGILRASVSSDLKVLLAYSTTENLGLIALAVGAYVLLQAAGSPLVASAVLLAALLLCAAHAAFKATLFLATGSVMHATGHRDLDALGGLSARMPTTAGVFGIGALGAAGLPATAGFVAEWVLLQSLVHATPEGAPVVDRLLFPVSVAVVALTVGLSILTFVKAYGIGFLGLPRSAGAADAHEAGPAERVSLVLGAIAVLALGLLPGATCRALVPLLPDTGADTSGHPLAVVIPGLTARLSPGAIVLLAAVTLIPVAATTFALARRHRAERAELPWGCGGVLTNPRMQYTATSFSEPVLRVFDDVLAPTRDVEVTQSGESQYLVERVDAALTTDDVVEHRVYLPLLRLLDAAGVWARRIQNGSIHRYIVYSFTAVVVVMVIAAMPL
ncbi:proton-conducting transporter transmembrane domain-containing protein [Gordonia sp. NPDC003424]